VISRVLRIFQVKELTSNADAETIRETLRDISGIVKVEPIIDAGVVEIEYENALVDRETIRRLFAEKGYTLLP